MSRKATPEEVVNYLNKNPNLFAALLERADVTGCVLIIPGKDPVEIRKEQEHV